MSQPASYPTYVLMPVHNRKIITLSMLSCLKKMEKQQFTIVVIDDGSTDDTSLAIQSEFPEVVLLHGNGSLWWTGAIALGMEYAYAQGADYMIWLNDDCELLSETLPALVQFCQENPGAIAGVPGFIKDQPHQPVFGGKRKTWQGYRYIQAEPQQIIPCDLLSGNIVCLPRTVIDRIGYPDLNRTPHYGGDSLYLIRAKKAGFEIFVDGRYPAWSVPGESSLYPSNWLACDGEPSRLLKLVFNRYSGLSWRVWFYLNWEAYGLWGFIMFLKKYASILLITALRYYQHFCSRQALS